MLKSFLKKIRKKFHTDTLILLEDIIEILKKDKIKQDEQKTKIEDILNKFEENTKSIYFEKLFIIQEKIDLLQESIAENNNYIAKVEEENVKLRNIIENVNITIDRRNSIRKVRVVFLIHNVESWYTMQPVYESMIEDEEFDPIIISVPRNYSSHDGTFEDKATEYLNGKYNRVISFKNYESIPDDILYVLNPDVIFRQSPWETDIPEVFRSENIKRFKICYIPYGIATLPLNEISFNQSLHKYAWRLYCESEFHKECYRKYNLVADSNVLVSGYTKFEQMGKIINGDSDDLEWPIRRKIKPSIKILWAPHHSLEGWFGFSTFHRRGSLRSPQAPRRSKFFQVQVLN